MHALKFAFFTQARAGMGGCCRVLRRKGRVLGWQWCVSYLESPHLPCWQQWHGLIRVPHPCRVQMEQSFDMQKSWGSMGEGETDEVGVGRGWHWGYSLQKAYFSDICCDHARRLRVLWTLASCHPTPSSSQMSRSRESSWRATRSCWGLPWWCRCCTLVRLWEGWGGIGVCVSPGSRMQ